MTSKILKISKISKISKSEEAIDLYLEDKAALSVHTLRNYSASLHMVHRYCNANGSSLLAATEALIAKFLNQYSFIKTKRVYRSHLKIFYNWCMRKRHRDDNPVEDIVLPKNGKKKQHTLIRPIDFYNMLNACQTLTEETIFSFLYYTGMRAKETRSMMLHDIDLDNGMIFINLSKTETGLRRIAIHPKLLPVLKDYMGKSQALRLKKGITYKQLFLNKHGNPFRRRTFEYLIERVQKTTGTKFTSHDFRRALITNVYNNSNNNIVLAQQLAGHASIETTRKYIITDHKKIAREFKALNF